MLWAFIYFVQCIEAANLCGKFPFLVRVVIHFFKSYESRFSSTWWWWCHWSWCYHVWHSGWRCGRDVLGRRCTTLLSRCSQWNGHWHQLTVYRRQKSITCKVNMPSTYASLKANKLQNHNILKSFHVYIDITCRLWGWIEIKMRFFLACFQSDILFHS